MSSPKPVVFILGPTATGKSSLAMSVANATGSCILNADSVQVYETIQIGAAKPSQEELKEVDHFLVGHVHEGDKYTAGQFRQEALEVLKLQTATRPVLVVGGSGFYVQALEKGMFELPPTDPAISMEIERSIKEQGSRVLWDEIKKWDPEAAAKIAPEDTYRVKRALEVLRGQDKTLTQIREEFKTQTTNLNDIYSVIKVGLRVDRKKLARRVRDRVEKMLEEGLLHEVESLLAKGLTLWAPLQSVGYKECVAVLQGELPEQDLPEAIVTSTMQLAKKQMTWFRKDNEIIWFDSEQEINKAHQFLLEKLTLSK
ncbi:MAG: tRNA (adenosine(37)-N6)-dimethylallyltransferase MiaA [Pseudobdellovibrionaceae bacterium]|nr:MAG: tRNA (adenosine(37)-N6)-dimethylallyltransferase MiaA [Pseudobdellovibrionaceae bacterium]